ncbi:hypothetical protein GCM10011380_09010 [Sphingomonas metalli]|uniref:Cellulose-binding protein n=1 Tax=Sphingomonas metalli TaxID=1779358 RepID=A0A916WPZ1_9SPHN|nr:hypothetical protein [Sphingomonas metalli]GGB21616.1 hypothetical protein GCM10011380_09010 [Sphingomonas metalli]
MRIYLAALATFLSLGLASPGSAQTVSGCGTVAIPKADRTSRTKLTAGAACFDKAASVATGAAEARRAAIAALPTPTPSPSPTPIPASAPSPAPAEQSWKDCAGEGEACTFIGQARVRFGANGKFVTKVFNSGTQCGNQVFGDPAPGAAKRCSWQPTDGSEPVTADTPKALIPAGARAWPVVAKPTTMRGLLGINIAGPGAWFSGDQTYVNLLRGAEWRVRGWEYAARSDLGTDGIPKPELVAALQPLAIIKPALGSQTRDVAAFCTWKGKGTVTIEGAVHTGLRYSDHRADLIFVANRDMSKMTWLKIGASDPADPIRDLDCRAAADAGITDLFLPDVVAYYGNFGTLRMLDASGVNGSGKWRWESRTLPGDLTLGGDGGMPLEHQVALAAAAGADAWYNLSWNADEEFQRRMAQLIHDATPADRHVYIELSNETWNFSFPVAGQAMTDGAALNLSGDGDAFKSGLLLYAQRVAALMRIWTPIFADRPGQLVRVAATQQDNPWTAGVVVGESGLGRSGLIDALAVAPYFGAAVPAANPGVTSLDTLFPLLRADMTRILSTSQAQNRAIAKQYGLRLISYEGGQHVVSDNVDVVAGLNRDPRMAALYGQYIPEAIASNDADLLVLFSATGSISKWGAWGIREYAGQPRADAPKLDAVLTVLGR